VTAYIASVVGTIFCLSVLTFALWLIAAVVVDRREQGNTVTEPLPRVAAAELRHSVNCCDECKAWAEIIADDLDFRVAIDRLVELQELEHVEQLPAAVKRRSS
jgi:hypothetical protein